MGLVNKIAKGIADAIVPKSTPKLILEGFDPLNRLVQMIGKGSKYWVEVDGIAVYGKTKKDSELEFEYRLNDSNRNI